MKGYLFAFVVCLPHICPAQATLFVGPGGFATPTDAYAVANPGDVILLAPGTHSLPFLVRKAVTFRAVDPGTVTCDTAFASFPCSVNTVYGAGAAGGTVQFDGLQITVGIFAYLAGQLVLNDCTLSSSLGPLVAVFGGSLHLQRCHLLSGPNMFTSVDSLQATDCHVTILDSTIIAQDSDGNGIQLVRSTFQGSGLAVQASSDSAVNADVTSVIWLSDSTVTTLAPGCAVVGGSAQAARSSFAPDCGGILPDSVLSAEGQPMQAGSPFQIGFRTEPWHVVAVFASTRLGAPIWLGTAQPLVLDATDTWLVWVLSTDTNGGASTTWTVPMSPSLVNHTFWFQGIDCDAAPLQLSPVVGGIVR